MDEIIHNTEIFGAVIIFIGMFQIGYWKWGINRENLYVGYGKKKKGLIIIGCFLVLIGLMFLLAPEYFRINPNQM